MPGSLLISSSYDAAGSLTGLATTNATFTYTLNRAGHRLTEDAQVTGDPQNGEARFTFDPVGRLAGYTPPGSSLVPYGWDAVPNRTSAGGVTTTFDAAARPTSAGFAADLDGRLTAIPARGGAAAKSLAYDALGRLVSATMGGVTRTYAYDPLDRLATVSEGGSAVVRFRYVGQTASVAQLLDGAWAVTRNIGTDWSGTPLADWAAGGSGWRRLVSNGHGDLVAALAANGSVSSSLRLDPWGVPLRAAPAGYPALGFQGSWTDRTSTLVYARARWYDPVLATFTSEDALAGELADPPSRHLYAYGAGDPVDNYDPDGLFGYRVKTAQTFAQLASATLGAARRWPMLWNANRAKWGATQPSSGTVIAAGSCYWIPISWLVNAAERRARVRPGTCGGLDTVQTDLKFGFGEVPIDRRLPEWLAQAQRAGRLGDADALFSFTRTQLYSKTDHTSNYRPRKPTSTQWREINATMGGLNRIAGRFISDGTRPRQLVRQGRLVRNVWYLTGPDHPWWCGGPCTVGNFIFLRNELPSRPGLIEHEYIHIVQQEGRGLQVGSGTILNMLIGKGLGPANPEEAVPYAWEAWIAMFGRWEPRPWSIWTRPPYTGPAR